VLPVMFALSISLGETHDIQAVEFDRPFTGRSRRTGIAAGRRDHCVGHLREREQRHTKTDERTYSYRISVAGWPTRLSNRPARRRGTRTSTEVPAFGRLATFITPPTHSARSRMPIKP
jgi:hypothetical protein